MLSNLNFHHIGYAVRDIAKSSAIFINMGYSVSQTIIDPIQNVKIALLSKVDNPLIELVEATDDKSPVLGIISKVGVSAYHICYQTSDIEQTISELKKQRFLCMFKPVEAVAFGNRKICYLYHSDVGLIELLSER